MSFAKVKNYLLLVLAVFLIIALWQFKVQGDKLKFEKSEKERIYVNWLNANRDATYNSVQIIREKELTAKMHRERDSLAKLVNTRPKFVEKIEHRMIYYTLSGMVPVNVIPVSQFIFNVTDSTKCFTWKGQVILSDNIPKVNRTGFSYHSEFTEVSASKILKKKIWFIKFYDKKNVTVQLSDSCGTMVTKTTSFLK